MWETVSQVAFSAVSQCQTLRYLHISYCNTSSAGFVTTGKSPVLHATSWSVSVTAVCKCPCWHYPLSNSENLLTIHTDCVCWHVITPKDCLLQNLAAYKKYAKYIHRVEAINYPVSEARQILMSCPATREHSFSFSFRQVKCLAAYLHKMKFMLTACKFLFPLNSWYFLEKREHTSWLDDIHLSVQLF